MQKHKKYYVNREATIRVLLLKIIVNIFKLFETCSHETEDTIFHCFQ